MSEQSRTGPPHLPIGNATARPAGPTVRPTDWRTARRMARPPARPSDRPVDRRIARPPDRPTTRLSARTADRPNDGPTPPYRPGAPPTDRPSDRPPIRPPDRPAVHPPAGPLLASRIDSLRTRPNRQEVCLPWQERGPFLLPAHPLVGGALSVGDVVHGLAAAAAHGRGPGETAATPVWAHRGAARMAAPGSFSPATLPWVRLGASSGEVVLRVGRGGGGHGPEVPGVSPKNRPEAALQGSGLDGARLGFGRTSVLAAPSGSAALHGAVSTGFRPNPNSGGRIPAENRGALTSGLGAHVFSDLPWGPPTELPPPDAADAFPDIAHAVFWEGRWGLPDSAQTRSKSPDRSRVELGRNMDIDGIRATLTFWTT